MKLIPPMRQVTLGAYNAPCCGCVITSIATLLANGGFDCDCRCHETAKWIAKR